MTIRNISSVSSFGISCAIDLEHQEIMRRLLAYGITPTGNKTADKANLRKIELEKAKQENSVSNKFLTVTKSEQENIQAKKKEKKKELNPELSPEFNPNDFKGSKIMGEQIFLALKIKKDKIDKK